MLSTVSFPVRVSFQDGTIEEYESIADLELNLENFDSEASLGCSVSDCLGRAVVLKIDLLELQVLRLATK